MERDDMCTINGLSDGRPLVENILAAADASRAIAPSP